MNASSPAGQPPQYTLEADGLYAVISTAGAELRQFGRGGQPSLLWDADPQYWARSAPVLFPIVGRLPEDRYTHAGWTYHLGQHGFARDQNFTVEQHEAGYIRLCLTDNTETLAHYPFAFTLLIEYRLDQGGLDTRFSVRNRGQEPMPFAIGGHPGFLWPLEPGPDKNDYVLVFEHPEAGQRYLVSGGLLSGELAPLPWQGQLLPLDATLFVEDAIVLRQPRSDWVCFQPRQGGLGIRVDFPGFPDLGIWSKPGGAPFLCIEPWHGHASFVDEGQELVRKRDLRILPAGAQFDCHYRTRIVDAPRLDK